jgi:hypothetical protein
MKIRSQNQPPVSYFPYVLDSKGSPYLVFLYFLRFFLFIYFYGTLSLLCPHF